MIYEKFFFSYEIIRDIMHAQAHAKHLHYSLALGKMKMYGIKFPSQT